MIRKEALFAGVLISLLAGALSTGCSDDGGDGGDGAAGAGGERSDAGTGGAGGAAKGDDATGGKKGDDASGGKKGDDATGGKKGDDEDEIEAPSSCAILEPYVGKYKVTGPPTDNEHRGSSTAEHERETVEISADFAIDFDKDISFEPTDITTCYDRTKQDFDRRVHVSYGADDNGEVINLYLNEDLEVVEIQFRHYDGGANIRVAVEKQ